MKRTFIKDIRAGDKLKEIFLVSEKSLAYSQKGLPYLNIKLKDKSGEISAKVWENALEIDNACQKGELALVTCWASAYRGMTQLTIVEMKKVPIEEVALEDFFPTIKGNIEEMYAELLAFADSIEDGFLRELLHRFLDDEQIAKSFKRSPAAKAMHHTALGGLLEHTLAVTRILAELARLYPDLRRDLLISGGILHDIGKIKELSAAALVDYTTEGRLIGHVVIGLEMLDEKLALLENFPPPLAIELRHILLSHHGEFEFGSPKRPKTKEALLIHQVDDLDAKLSAFDEHIEGDNSDSEWTTYHRLLERYLYKGSD